MKFSAIVAFIGCLCVSVGAQAGHPAAPAVTFVVSGSTTTASGSLGAAHNSSNQQEEVGCAVKAYHGAMEVSCSFTKANGQRAQCRASADVGSPDAAIERMAKVVATVNGSSFVEATSVHAFNSDGVLVGEKCTSIKVTNSSQYVAKNSATKTVTSSNFVLKSEVQAPLSGDIFEVSGTLSKVRRSNDSIQRIGCEFQADESLVDGSVPTAFCYAVDRNDNSYSCFTDIPNQILALRGIKSDSNLWFYDSPTGSIDCNSRVEVVNSSSYDASH